MSALFFERHHLPRSTPPLHPGASSRASAAKARIGFRDCLHSQRRRRRNHVLFPRALTLTRRNELRDKSLTILFAPARLRWRGREVLVLASPSRSHSPAHARAPQSRHCGRTHARTAAPCTHRSPCLPARYQMPSRLHRGTRQAAPSHSRCHPDSAAAGSSLIAKHAEVKHRYQRCCLPTRRHVCRTKVTHHRHTHALRDHRRFTCLPSAPHRMPRYFVAHPGDRSSAHGMRSTAVSRPSLAAAASQPPHIPRLVASSVAPARLYWCSSQLVNSWPRAPHAAPLPDTSSLDDPAPSPSSTIRGDTRQIATSTPSADVPLITPQRSSPSVCPRITPHHPSTRAVTRRESAVPRAESVHPHPAPPRGPQSVATAA